MTREIGRYDRLAGGLLVALAFVLPLALSTRKSVTVDEAVHIPAGYSYLRTGEVVLNPMHPPLVKELAAIPLLFMGLEMPESGAAIRRLGVDVTYQREFARLFYLKGDIRSIVFRARVAAVLLSAALATLIFVWTRQLWGPAGGLIALFLYVFDPTVTAHAQIVTTDVGFALFGALFVFLLSRYLLHPSPARLAAAGVALGAALGAKFSAVVLVPVAIVLAGATVTQAPAHERFRQLARFSAAILMMTVVAGMTLWAVYLFPPNPDFYLRGLNAVRTDNNPQYAQYLMGDFRIGSWPHYFLVAWLIKTPLPAIIALLLSAWLFVRGRRATWLTEAFLLLPPAAVFAGYAFAADPAGIRYLIPCYPFLFVFAGRIGPWMTSFPRRAVIAALGIWCIVEFVAIAPDHLSYFNQIARGPDGGLAWLDDSNVDWGQGLIQLGDYLRENPVKRFRLCPHVGVDPERYGIHGESIWIRDLLSPPIPGVWILSGHCVARARAWLAIEHGDGPENWFAHVKPTAVVGHAYYVYEIPEAAE